MSKITTIYNNYDLTEIYPDEDIIESLMENDNSLSKENISDNDIWEERYLLDSLDWEEENERLIDFFDTESESWILVGSLGRWNGTFDGGFIFSSFKEMWHKATKDCDYFNIYDKDGHLHIECSHHDGTNHYEIKKLNSKGQNLYDKWSSDWDDKRSEREIHNIIWKSNLFSSLPHFAKQVYGC